MSIDEDPIEWFEEIAENAVAVQTQTLRRILDQNRGTEYLRKWLGDVRVQDLEDSELESLYTKSVPLATHPDFEPFIQRIADGDTSPILTQQPINSLSLTYVYFCVIILHRRLLIAWVRTYIIVLYMYHRTGTTEGRQKYIPFTLGYVETFHKAMMLDNTLISRYFFYSYDP